MERYEHKMRTTSVFEYGMLGSLDRKTKQINKKKIPLGLNPVPLWRKY